MTEQKEEKSFTENSWHNSLMKICLGFMTFTALFVGLSLYNLYIYTSFEGLPVASILISDSLLLIVLFIIFSVNISALGLLFACISSVSNYGFYDEFISLNKSNKFAVNVKYSVLFIAPLLFVFTAMFLEYKYHIVPLRYVCFVIILYYIICFYFKDKKVDLSKVVMIFVYMVLIVITSLTAISRILDCFEEPNIPIFDFLLPTIAMLFIVILLFRILIVWDLKELWSRIRSNPSKYFFGFLLVYLCLSTFYYPRRIIYGGMKIALSVLDAGGGEKIIIYPYSNYDMSDMKKTLGEDVIDEADGVKSITCKNIFSLDDIYYIEKDGKSFSVKKCDVRRVDFNVDKESDVKKDKGGEYDRDATIA